MQEPIVVQISKAIFVSHFHKMSQVWSFDIFSCFDEPGTCCISCLCPCIQFGEISSEFDQRNCFTCGAAFAILAYCNLDWCLHTYTRLEIREKYGIEGSVIEDCLCATCCRACALTQARREVEFQNAKAAAAYPGMNSMDVNLPFPPEAQIHPFPMTESLRIEPMQAGIVNSSPNAIEAAPKPNAENSEIDPSSPADSSKIENSKKDADNEKR
jgi:Cys-rich protein (TIGR01571 family)